jgi:hypothetical protein
MVTEKEKILNALRALVVMYNFKGYVTNEDAEIIAEEYSHE